ncbi:uncharacterized protein B0H18DRAFT_344964 [Fomitopsis serialis]|uniref:uncharacterized protein n=1 Tax=Fomitopsis serialis TaxID=139415 RepID=UPI002007FF1D|nr:uncharacterized protein B0H18DRAFT_344964 [Neoantrodia serialis]KAH9926505.1 hypothetical protein B0H18DRAFT_344964 [Neoantrodia serialis]
MVRYKLTWFDVVPVYRPRPIRVPATLPTPCPLTPIFNALIISNMLSAVSSWGPHPALRPPQQDAQSSHYASPPPAALFRPLAEQDAIEALLSMASSSAPPRPAIAALEHAGPSQALNTARQAQEPAADLELDNAAGPIAGPSCERAPAGSTVRPTTGTQTTDAAERPPSSPAARTDTGTRCDSPSAGGPVRRSRKGKERAAASPLRRPAPDTDEFSEEVKGSGLTGRAMRKYYIEEAKWIGKDKETGEYLPETSGHKCPATAYQNHILTWIFDNVTPYPEDFWRALLAVKLRYNYGKVYNWFTNQRQKVNKQRKENGTPAPYDLEVVWLTGRRKQRIRSCAIKEGEQWTDGKFLATIKTLIADRQRQFEEEVANHLARFAAGSNVDDSTADDEQSSGEGDDDMEVE